MMLKQLPLKLPTFNELAFSGADSYSNILVDTVLTTYYRIYCLFFPKMWYVTIQKVQKYLCSF